MVTITSHYFQQWCPFHWVSLPLNTLEGNPCQNCKQDLCWSKSMGNKTFAKIPCNFSLHHLCWGKCKTEIVSCMLHMFWYRNVCKLEIGPISKIKMLNMIKSWCVMPIFFFKFVCILSHCPCSICNGTFPWWRAKERERERELKTKEPM